MKSKVMAIFVVAVVFLCVLSPFVVSDMQNRSILEKEYLVKKEEGAKEDSQNLLQKIKIYKEGKVIESTALPKYEMYGNYYTEIDQPTELASGFSYILEKVQNELKEMEKRNIIPSEIREKLSRPEETEWILQSYVSDDISYETVMTWQIWFELEEYATWVHVVLETGSYKIIEVYHDATELQKVGNEQIAKQFGNYLGVEDIIITGREVVQYRLEDVTVLYQIGETGINCFD